MKNPTPEVSRRLLLTGSAAAAFGMASVDAPPLALGASGGQSAIHPFHVSIAEADLVDLRQRISATKFPERETVSDASQGVELATIQKLARYWATEYDFRKCEAKLNGVSQFVTNIDRLDIHFIHMRSRHPKALPLIVTHGWPGSIIEQLKIIDPLTNPTAHGGSAADAFDVVIPSLPGHGFSGKPSTTGWDPARIARAWVVLMKRLGYTRYVAQGGDWGNAVTEQMALLAPAGLLAIHTNMPATVPDDVAKALEFGEPPPPRLSAEERGACDQLDFFYKNGLATRRRWRTARRPSMGFWIHRLAWPPGCSTMMLGVKHSLRVCSTVSPRASRATTSSTTSRSTG